MKIGIFGLLGVVFVVLKLAEVTAIATWSWWLVLLPFYGPLAIFAVIGLACVIVGATSGSSTKARRR